MAAYELVTWLYGVAVAVVREQRTGKVTLEYTQEAYERWRLGDPVLSVALPLRPDRYPPSQVAPFLEGLIPEGEARTTLESNFRIRRGDTFGFLAALGHDCAGAVVFQRSDEPPVVGPTPTQLLSHDDVVAELEALGARPLGADATVRLSLAGQQDKLLLARTVDGAWARPVDGVPSTHILKPEDPRLPGHVVNEAFCLRVAGGLGLTSIAVEELDAHGRPVLVVSRYDRSVDHDGSVTRIHQEDLCQALGLPIAEHGKYEDGGGPTLRAVAQVLDTWSGRVDDLEQLLRVTTLNVVVGNADAHGKNVSLLHHPVRGTTLAPLYDVASTIEYRTMVTSQGERPVSTALAMRIDGVTDIHAVTVDHLVAEAHSWSLTEARARGVVDDLLDRMPDAIDAAVRGTPAVQTALVTRTRARMASLARGAAAGAA